MTIEFRKVRQEKDNFDITINDNIKVKGNFFYNTAKRMVQLDASLAGDIEVDCCRCGEVFIKNVDLNSQILINDGVIKNNHNDDDFDCSIYEVQNHKIDFEEILSSEIDSFKLDYHVCEDCEATEEFNVEYE
jgi:uncharacterized metal-binding protein YceD (DUF177 family)